MSKTINQLCNLANYKGYSTQLAGIYDGITNKANWTGGTDLSSWKTTFKGLFDEKDYLPISHKMSDSDNDYVTFKVPLTAYESVMHSIRLNALSTEISAALQLCSLAWMNEKDLNLGLLAKKDYIEKEDLKTGDKFTLDQINTTWGDLLSTNLSTLRLSALAHENKIVNEFVADDAAISCSKIAGLGDLATKDEVELSLAYMSHRPYVDLSRHSRGEGSDPGTYDVTGMLDQKYIANAYKYTLPVANNDILGGIETGFAETGNEYAIKLADKKAYVKVPWTDIYAEVDTFEVESAGDNRFRVKFVQKTHTRSAEKPIVDTKSNTIFNQTITLTPYIRNNVIFNDTDGVNYSELNNSIAVFSDNSSDRQVTLSCGAKIDKTSTEQKYLKVNGSWDAIPSATHDNNGLLTNVDKVFIDSLRNKKDYSLSVASNSILGGIKLASVIPDNATTFESYQSKEVISLPLRVNTETNIAYVNIPKSVGDTTSFDEATKDAANSAVETKLEALYPVGAIYITTASTCPLSTLIAGSKWKKIEGYYLLASGKLAGTNENYTTSAGSSVTVGAGLPAHGHNLAVGCGSCSCGSWKGSVKNYHSSGSPKSTAIDGINGFAQSQTVRPPSFIVNVFMRTE